jgi:hypothetical protein
VEDNTGSRGAAHPESVHLNRATERALCDELFIMEIEAPVDSHLDALRIDAYR